MEGIQRRVCLVKTSRAVPTSPPEKTKSPADVDDWNLKRNNYCKILLLIIDVASVVIQKYITEEILNGNTFESFLNEKTIRHALVHSFYPIRCCECPPQGINSNNRRKNPGYKQLFHMYACHDMNIIKAHKKYMDKQKLAQQCICKYAAKPVKVKDLDITAANWVINLVNEIGGIYTIRHPNVVKSVEEIVKTRNEMMHLSDLRAFSIQSRWEILAASIMGIANKLGKDENNEYAQFVRYQIEDIFKLTLKGVKSTQCGRQCSAYFDTKFEESQDSKMGKKLKLTILYNKITKPDMDRINNYKQRFETKINNTDIKINVTGRSNIDLLNVENSGDNDEMEVLIPVLLHLRVPIGWNRQRIIDSVKGMQLQGTSDMSIHINSILEDLTIVANVPSSSLKDDKELTSKIEEVIASIISKTGIDTQESAEVGVDFDIANNKVDDESYLHFENVDGNTFQPLENENVDDESYLHFENVDGNTFQPLENENVSEETYGGEPLQIEIGFPEKFYIERPRKSSAVDKTLDPHFCRKIVDCILINRQIILTDYYNSKLLIHNLDGHNNSTIHLNGQPRYVSMIRDDKIAISYIKPIALASGKVGNIDIIDINTGLENTIENVWEVGCMTYQDEHLFVVIDGRKIVVMNLTGLIDRSFNCPSLNISNISSDKDLLYLTDSGMNKLFCCDIFGELKWEFKHDCLKMPSSVTVDPYHNVYVTGHRSENVVIVSPDGRKYWELLPERIDVKFPIIIRYDKANKYLVAFNYFRGDAFLLDVKTSFTEPTTYYRKEIVTLKCV